MYNGYTERTEDLQHNTGKKVVLIGTQNFSFFLNFHCYTVHVVELLSYYINICTYTKFIKFYTLKH
jgi:hypothetical protein